MDRDKDGDMDKDGKGSHRLGFTQGPSQLCSFLLFCPLKLLVSLVLQ